MITIKTGRMGWVKVTVRRATGKFVWLMQLQNRIRSIGEKVSILSDENRKDRVLKLTFHFTGNAS